MGIPLQGMTDIEPWRDTVVSRTPSGQRVVAGSGSVARASASGMRIDGF